METLQEFVEKQIALADFRYDKGQGLFHLYYFPLNDDERADLISTGSSKNELLTDHLQNNDGDSPDSKVKIVQTSLDFS